MVKLILNKKGLWLTGGTILLLAFLFIKTYMETIVRIPSPEFEAVRRFYWWLIVFGCGFLACLGAALWILKTQPFLLFPGTVVVLGLFYMLVLTPFSTPDESAHFVSAYRLSSQLMGKAAVADDAFLAHATEEEKERIGRGANVLVRSGDDVTGLYTEVGRTTYNLVLTELFSLDNSQGMTVRYEIPVNTTPVVYLPQAIGISLARLLRLGYIPLVYLGRLFNLLAFAAMAALSVRIMPFKKELLMAVSCLPMTLHLAASFSYDTAFIGLSMVFLAWCFFLAFEKEKVTVKDTVILALLLILLEPGKIVYLPVAGICLFIPASKFKSEKHYWISVISVIGAVILAVYLVNRMVLSAWATSTESYVGWSEAAGYTLQDVWDSPYCIFQVYYETLVTQFDYYLTTMLGGFLGNLDPNLTVPPFCLSILWYVLIVSVIRREGEEAPMTGGQKLWMIFLVFLSACLVLASMLLGWTPRELTYITGVQGRYFIPLLPLVLLVLFDKHLVTSLDLRKSAWYLECFVSIYALIRICSTACLRY
ncbi:DUF2142 domain-containing protein [Lacrimispora indolis]|uniref:DUF2142 domain-containing protein n=1 Tax=Lacrimispora indolis TaxID=69825 RepID=UPI00045E95FD|nr:DUF2142 domain-containing protein [Lacrimispora indolis]